MTNDTAHTLKDFFRVLFDEGDKVNIRVIHDEKGKAGAHNHIYNYPGVSLCEEYPTMFPCAGINPRVTQKKLSAIKNLVIDMDGHALPEWAAEHADMICSRDDTHHHLYFCFNPIEREEYKAITARLVKQFKAVDKMVSDPERVMRLPEFTHRKEGTESPGYKVVFIRDNIKRIEASKKFAWVKEIKEETAPSVAPVTSIKSVIDYIKSVYARKPILNKGDGRSRELFFIGLDCHTWGIEQSAAVELARDISSKRYDPPESDSVIKKQVESAFRYARGEFGAALRGETLAAQQKEKRMFELVQKVREKMASWVYVHEACRLIDTESDRVLTSPEQIDNFISGEVGDVVALRTLLSRSALQVCDKIEFAPRIDERTFTTKGCKFYNSYRPNTEELKRDPKLKKTASKAFIDHVNFIATSPEEQKTLLEYFAYCVQNVGQKVDWTPLIISTREGLGKSAFSVLFRNIFGEHNCSTVSAARLLSGWTDFIAEKLFVTSHEVETNEASALTELKTLITESRVRVNAKYARTYETNNCANFLLLSNKLTALKLERNSRRFFVIVNKEQPKEKEYYKQLFDCIDNGAGWIYDMLMKIDLSAFEPHGNAIETAGLTMVADASLSDSTAWLDEQREAKKCGFGEQIVSITDIEREAGIFAPTNVTRYLSRKVIQNYLHSRDYTPKDYYVGSEHKRGWFKGTADEFKKAVEEKRGGVIEAVGGLAI